MELIYLVIGLLIGGIISFFLAKSLVQSRFVLTREQKGVLDQQLNALTVSRQVSDENLARLQDEMTKTSGILDLERTKNLSLSTSLASSESEAKHLLEKLENQKKDIEELQGRLNIQFRNLANEILEEKSKKFADQNKLQIAEILNPLKEKISDFEKKVEQTNNDSIARNASLKQQITSLTDLNQKITLEAANLTKALKGETKSQGTWGEFILEKILEKSGLVKGTEYFTQESHTSDDGRRYQPDVIVKLPDDKNIIIDAKVSLVAYERFVNEEDDDAREEHMKDHITSIRNHIRLLNEKSYQSLDIKGLDFVLLFMPVEPAFSVALQHDDRLFMDAYDKNIVIVSPSTLIATLRTIASIWRQENQNRNAMEIARQGGDLYDKFVNFTHDLMQLGDKINSTQRTYEDAMKKLSTGTGNLVTRADKLKKLGAKTKNSLDQKLLGDPEDESN
jgi:DNA recombination protein RmuC